MKKVTIYHNPSCGNSRGAIDPPRAQKVEFDIVEYLKSPLSRATLESMLGML